MSRPSTSDHETTSAQRVERPCACRTESFRFCPCYSTRTWQRGDPTTDLPVAPVWRPSQHKKMDDAA
jgi:hypothetical protein